MIPIPGYSVVEAQVLAFFRNRFPGRDTHTESFLGKLARSVARTISYLLVSLQSVDQDAVPSQKTSRTALNNMAFAYGLASNLGGYGANGAIAATGGQVTLTGTNGVTFPANTLLTAPDGVTILQTTQAASIPGTPPGSGAIAAPISAVTAGSAGNLAAGTLLSLQTPPSGGDSSARMASPTAGGLDAESSPSLLARIFSRWQNPPKGGTPVDYRTWAESVAGVARAYVYPKHSGTGSVDLVITSGGTGTARDPGATIASNVSAAINGSPSATPPILGLRPVTVSSVNVRRPAVSALGLAIRARIVPSQVKYAFDWMLGTSPFTVSSWSSPTLTMNQPLPASLVTAVNTYAAPGSTSPPPRLQVIPAAGLPNGAPYAVPVNVIACNTSLNTLTLQTPLPAGWTAPASGDVVYPYSSAVPVLAGGALSPAIGGVQGYVDSLGPSRASGYANPTDIWNDTASIFNIGEVVLDATDIDGVTKPASRLLGVTINGGTTDVTATDTPAAGIQLLTCASIAITD